MSESTYTRALLEFLGKRIEANKNSVMFKLSDRFTVGVPDLVVVVQPRGTTWLELKDLKTRTIPTFRDISDVAHESALQLHNMRKISLTTGNAWYVFHHTRGTYITRPEYLYREVVEIRDLSLRRVWYDTSNYYEDQIDQNEGRVIFLSGNAHFVVWDLCTRENIR